MLVLRVRKKKPNEETGIQTMELSWPLQSSYITYITIITSKFFHFALKLPFENRFEIDYRFETPEAKGNALQLANTLKQELFGQ